MITDLASYMITEIILGIYICQLIPFLKFIVLFHTKLCHAVLEPFTVATGNQFLTPLIQKCLAKCFCNHQSIVIRCETQLVTVALIRVSNTVRHVYYLWLDEQNFELGFIYASKINCCGITCSHEGRIMQGEMCFIIYHRNGDCETCLSSHLANFISVCWS